MDFIAWTAGNGQDPTFAIRECMLFQCPLPNQIQPFGSRSMMRAAYWSKCKAESDADHHY
jgi:hypothetical protein